MNIVHNLTKIYTVIILMFSFSMKMSYIATEASRQKKKYIHLYKSQQALQVRITGKHIKLTVLEEISS